MLLDNTLKVLHRMLFIRGEGHKLEPPSAKFQRKQTHFISQIFVLLWNGKKKHISATQPLMHGWSTECVTVLNTM